MDIQAILQEEILDSYRLKGDELADKAVAALFAQPEKAALWRQQLREVRGNSTPIPSEFPQEVKDCFEQSAQLPAWANPSLMAVGARFFAFHSQDIMSLLGYYSLPYCYASATGVQVLHQSERMGYDTVKRLAETGSFVFDVLKENAFQPTGFGLRSIQQVRLLHASIRYHLLQRGNWPTEEYGHPINQEDMLGTNLSFSLIVLRGLRKLGHIIQPKEIEAYMHLWAVIGYVMGIEESLIPQTAKEAYWIEQKSTMRSFRPSEEGRSLTQALLKSMEELSPDFLPKGFSNTYMRFFLGEEIADIIEVPKVNWSIGMVKSRVYWNRLTNFFQVPELADLERRVSETEALTKANIVISPGYTVADM